MELRKEFCSRKAYKTLVSSTPMNAMVKWASPFSPQPNVGLVFISHLHLPLT